MSMASRLQREIECTMEGMKMLKESQEVYDKKYASSHDEYDYRSWQWCRDGLEREQEHLMSLLSIAGLTYMEQYQILREIKGEE